MSCPALIRPGSVLTPGYGEEGHKAQIAHMNDLLSRMKAKLPELEELSGHMQGWEENGVYRFYQFKVFYCQDYVKDGFKLIQGNRRRDRPAA
jgi:hypothetical protein